MAVRLDHNFLPGVSYHAFALDRRPARSDCDPVSGGDSGGVTPVPIPNTAVKPSSADGTARVAWWESRTLPGFHLASRPSPDAAQSVGAFFVGGTGGRLASSQWPEGEFRCPDIP